LIGLAVVGGVPELVRFLVPGRSCDITDETANTAGVLAGAMLVYSWRLLVRAAA